jgi:diguanylate cyclase (GGDEF)-like protein
VSRDVDSPAPVSPAAPPADAARRILIIDDDRTVCQVLAKMVEESGHQPVVAASWSDALRLYREAKPDLVLLDVMMPTIDGYKMAGIFRREQATFVPIILLTALDDLESKRRGMAAGADDFLTKPVTQLELQIRVSSLLRIKALADELERAKRELEQLAVTDQLTSLPNRRHLNIELEREFNRSKRYGHPLSVLMLDIDHFKKVNDNYGHQIGDRVLMLAGEVLRQSVRNTDICGRFGGEEFMVLAPETGYETVEVVAERIRQNLKDRTSAAGGEIPPVTISIGVATTEHPETATADGLVRLADQALYRAKHQGRDRVVLAQPAEQKT